MFKKIIKRHDSLLSNFKDGIFWDNQCRSTIATTNSQDIADLLHTDYYSASPEKISLFHEKQKFVLSVFDKVLHIDRGENHAQEHEHDFNAQEIYKKLVTFCTESTKARENVTEILSHVTLSKLDSWKVTSE